MDFAKRELVKYGWSEGEGLGKNRDGISKALKPKYKFDNAGLGHDGSEEFTNPWWERVYNDAANNIVTKRRNDAVVLDTKGDESVEIAIKKRKKSKGKRSTDDGNDEREEYKGFIKTSELEGNRERKICKGDDWDGDEGAETSESGGVRDISDEELLRICGGRTVHKGARHGLKMSAKLARLQEHEQELMKTLDKKVRDYEEKVGEVIESRVKKKKKKKLKRKDM